MTAATSCPFVKNKLNLNTDSENIEEGNGLPLSMQLLITSVQLVHRTEAVTQMLNNVSTFS